MKTIATPRSRIRLTVAKRLITSCGDSAAVGSSMIKRRALVDSAFAISSSCRSATPSPRTGVSGPKSTPSSSRMIWTFERICDQSTDPTRPRGCRPANTFSATVRSGKTVGSWYMATKPSRCAASGSPIRRGSPSTTMSPASGWTTPVRILTRVDLPAPFSPTSACTVAFSIGKLTSDTAWAPP
jgi:hypothetical protein